jgi:hypothetical protein
MDAASDFVRDRERSPSTLGATLAATPPAAATHRRKVAKRLQAPIARPKQARSRRVQT